MRYIRTFLVITSIAAISPPGGYEAKSEETRDPGDISIEDVDLTTSDNVRLKATYYAPPAPGPGALLIHMCQGDADRNTWTRVGRDLAQSGIHALAVDLRGYGESEGGEPPFTTMPNFIAFWRSTGISDVNAAYDYLSSQPGVNDDVLGVAGASCGVFLGIEFASHHENVRALALLSGPFDDTAAEQLSDLSDVPVLGAASEGDSRAYEAMKRVFLATSNPNSRNLQFKGTMHGTRMFDVAPDLEEEIADWFARWLPK